jgi:hypothetical protein
VFLFIPIIILIGALFGKDGVSDLSKAEASALIDLLTDDKGNLHSLAIVEVGEFLDGDGGSTDDNEAGE